MAYLTQNWTTYVTRTYQQIKTQVLTNLQSRVPEITDHTEGNIFVKMVGIWGGVAEMLGYYTDNTAREAFLPTCRLYKSAVKISKTQDYRIHARVAATVDLEFTIDVPAPSAVTIPINTEVKTVDGLSFFTTAIGLINIGDTTVTVPAKQSVAVTNLSLGNSDGSITQEIAVTSDMEDSSGAISVASLAWFQKDTLGFSLPADTHFVQSVNELGLAVIRFGDGFNGAVPPNGDPIVINYFRTEGINGNVQAATITNIQGTITLPMGVSSIVCTNPDRASGGADVESIDQIRRRAPLALRTLRRAVTEQDYIDVAELASGVIRAGVIFNCGKYVEVYIVPDGGGIASTGLVSATQTWMDERKMLTTEVAVKAAGEVRVLYQVDVQVLPQYTNSVVAAAVQANLALFQSYLFQQIGGQTQLGDAYQVIEDTPGVQYSKIKVMTPVPYARLLYSTTTVLNWARVVATTNTATDIWTIKFTNSTNFQLLKNNVFLGNFTTGVAVVRPEITFTITNNGYAVNDQYEFITYPYFGTIVLAEPSLPVSLVGDITVTALGGV